LPLKSFAAIFKRSLNIHSAPFNRKNPNKSGIFKCEECESKGSHYSIVAIVFNSEIFR